MTLKPLNNKIVVVAKDKETVTPGGIILPDTAQEPPRQGTVVAVGPGRILDNGQRAPVEVDPGDVVVYSRYGGNEVTVDGVDYVILDQDGVYAIIES